jgi:hypothetical protein
MNCPNRSQDGCCCPQHAYGLGTYSKDPVAYQAALSRCQPKAILTVLTREEPPKQVFYTDEPKKVRQPWEPRPARRAA